MASIDQVVREGLCVGCGACSVATEGRIKMVRNQWDFMQADVSEVSPGDLELGAVVCPFASKSKDENELADARFKSIPGFDQRIGYFRALFAGRLTDQSELMKSSSGGMTSWLLLSMMRQGLVDGVIHLGSTHRQESSNAMFEFKISLSPDDLLGRRKSQYYSASYDEAVLKIRGDGKRYAIVGVPCFIKAARALAESDDVLRDQLKYFVALVCGHMKSGSFAELLAWQLNVAPSELGAVDFRVKNPTADAGGYHTSAVSLDKTKQGAAMTRTMLGGNWGHAVFQLQACDYCDDIFGETADVCFGDAWIERYASNWQGTNIAVVRDARLAELFDAAQQAGQLTLDTISTDDLVRSQDGNFRHRWDGLSVRLLDRLKSGQWTPSKRIRPGSRNVPLLRRWLVRVRQRMSQQSHEAFRLAREKNDLQIFARSMAPHIHRMDQIYRLMRIEDRLKRYWARVFG